MSRARVLGDPGSGFAVRARKLLRRPNGRILVSVRWLIGLTGAAAAALTFGACASLSGLSSFSEDNGDATTSSSSGGHPEGSVDGTTTDDSTPVNDAPSGDDGGDGGDGGCPGTFLACGDGSCVDPSTTSNCGACGNVCSGATYLCAPTDGVYSCSSMCPTNAPVPCNGGTCTDIGNDPNNCGGCGNVCTTSIANASPTCAAGVCSFKCDSGYNPCNGQCVSYTTAANCGGCNDDAGGHACTGGTVCAASDGGAYSCVSGCGSLALCNGACVDKTSTATNCGTCGHVCTTSDPNAMPVCVSSACTVSCNEGYTLCGSSCVLLNTVTNCGYCGVACSAEAGTPVCSAAAADGGADGGGPAACVSGCPAGQNFCGVTCVTEATDTQNCGSCGHACPSVANAQKTCAGGTCGFTCNSGYTLCNGACVNEQTDRNNCGSCGHVCAADSGTPACSAGTCVSGCPASTPTSCSGTCVDTTSDANNCGGCGTRCTTSVGNAHAVCQSSSCTFACNTNYTACNGACVNEQTDKNNCGGCGTGHVCGSGQSCQNGTCACVASACPACPLLSFPCCKNNNTACGCSFVGLGCN